MAHGYCAACQEKKWFFEIDLAPAFTSAAWEILKFQARGANPRHVRFPELQEVVVNEYEEKLDRILLIKAMWDATSATFGSDDSKVQSKVYNALHKAYQGALDECIMDSRPLGDLEKVEMFTKRWIDDSMRRAWSSIEGSDRIITPQTVISLFRNLVAPFGADHPFSCVPANLIDNIGRPPSDWPFIKHTVSHMFTVWRQETAGPSSGKRRKTKSGHAPGGEDEDMPPLDPDSVEDEEPGQHAVRAAARRATAGRQGAGARPAQQRQRLVRREEPEEPPEDEEVMDGEGEVHPECTSQEDCCGSPADRLVRHRLDGDEGDVYCQSCWESFLEQNPQLDGVWEDTQEPYKA